MDTALDDLDPRFKPIAMELLARCVEKRVLVLIVNTRRTAAEQADAVARHVSWVTHSLHQDGLAIDIVPYSIWSLHGETKLNWDSTDPVWLTLGKIGESLGLRWGGRWAQRDMGHFEYSTPTPTIAA